MMIHEQRPSEMGLVDWAVLFLGRLFFCLFFFSITCRRHSAEQSKKNTHTCSRFQPTKDVRPGSVFEVENSTLIFLVQEEDPRERASWSNANRRVVLRGGFEIVMICYELHTFSELVCVCVCRCVPFRKWQIIWVTLCTPPSDTPRVEPFCWRLGTGPL